MIAILDVMAGAMLAFAWQYLMEVSPGLFGVLVAVCLNRRLHACLIQLTQSAPLARRCTLRHSFSILALD